MTPPAPLVLIVDDDPDMLDLVADALDRKGYRTMKAWNGEEALQLVAETEPQLVLLDMRMPVMDGWEFAHAFRERFGRRIPIVVVTAAEDSRLRAAEIGANADLGKPFELARLYEVVADTVGPA
jgi:two-component system, chemotaxis family, chemotaxis protein CheY